MSIISKIGYETSKEAARIVAPLAAVASMGADGDSPLDHLEAVVRVPHQIYEIGRAYVQDEGIRQFTLERLSDAFELIGSAAESLIERPGMTLGMAAGIYATTRFLPHMAKYVGSKLKKGEQK